MLPAVLRSSLTALRGAACLSALALCLAPSAAAQDGDGPAADIRIATGSPAGTYFIVGRALCHTLRRASDTGPSCEAKPTAGSLANIERLRSGDANVAVVQSDVQYHAANGTGPLDGKGLEDMRALFSVYLEPFHLVTRADKPVSALTDLKPLRMNVGNPGSGQRATFETLLGAANVPLDFAERTELDAISQAQALCDGDIDGFVHVISAPDDTIAKTVRECDAAVRDVPSEALQFVTQDNPFYAEITVPASAYGAAFTSFGPSATVVVRGDLPDETVTALLSAALGDADGDAQATYFSRLHPSFKSFSNDQRATTGITARYHPAALAFFTKRGIF